MLQSPKPPGQHLSLCSELSLARRRSPGALFHDHSSNYLFKSVNWKNSSSARTQVGGGGGSAGAAAARSLRRPGRELISWGARAGLFQPGAVQTGQFTAAKRAPNYNRITDAYPPRQASRGRGGVSLPAGGSAGSSGFLGLRIASLMRPGQRMLANCVRSLTAGGGSLGRSFLSGLWCRKPCLFRGLPLT